jgi:hypothetical protein
MNISINKIRQTLRAAFPNADIKVSKIKHADDDIDLVVTSQHFDCREALEALVTKSYGVEYIGRRCKDGIMLGDTYGSRWDFRHRFDFITPE